MVMSMFTSICRSFLVVFLILHVVSLKKNDIGVDGFVIGSHCSQHRSHQTKNNKSGLWAKKLPTCGDCNSDNDSSMKRNQFQRSMHRKEFISRIFLASGGIATMVRKPPATFAFDGGVGGLGKTRPETGVVFRNTDLTMDISSNNNNGVLSAGGDITTELVTANGTPVILSFSAPWPMSRSAAGIESRDLANPEAAYVQVSPLPNTKNNASAALPTSFFVDAIFGPQGKYGMYGTPTDIKVKKINLDDNTNTKNVNANTAMYLASFTTLTPAMRESERKAYISVSIIDNDTAFMLVTGTTAARFKSQNDLLLKTANSFSCVPAPKSNLKTK